MTLFLFRRADEIQQMFSFTDLNTPDSDVTFISVYKDESLKSGICRSGMVEFLTTSSIYEKHSNNVRITIQGHIFKQGDLKVKVGVLNVNYPKFLIV